MRILYLIDNFSLGGAQTVVKGLMDNSGPDSEEYAIALRKKEPLMSMDHPGALTFPSRSRFSFRLFRYLKRFIREKQIDILHCQLPRSIATGYLLKRAFPGIKYIIHEQGDVFESRVHAFLLKLFRGKADGVLACSEATASMLSKRAHVDRDKVKVLYNFVDLDRFYPGKDPKDQVQKIAFAGRIEKRKGWREFIRAASAFQDREELSFYLAGSGTEVKKLRHALEKEGSTRISHVGFVDRMQEFYQDMDLLVIPSHFEPMGMVAVEAMACGTPVLATDVPGLNEVVKHEVNGWTCAARSSRALVRAIREILDMPADRRESITRQGTRDAQGYSLREFSLELQQFYNSLHIR